MNAHHFTNKPSWHRKLNTFVTALVFIIAGVFLLGRNQGWVDPSLFNVVVSWQMLLIVIGITLLIKKNVIGGIILIAVGSYFLIPSVYGIGSYWPLILVAIGIFILFQARKNKNVIKKESNSLDRVETVENESGFVVSDVTFGSARHIVLDSPFKGASLDATFGGIILDLRHTHLEMKTTYIDVDVTFSGIDIFVSSSWNLIIETETTLGGVNDKRLLSQDIDKDHQLVIRGDITLGGININN